MHLLVFSDDLNGIMCSTVTHYPSRPIPNAIPIMSQGGHTGALDMYILYDPNISITNRRDTISTTWEYMPSGLV